jgi:uncharacterized protein (DUF1015 family)
VATIRPFRALRPLPESAVAVASVPYDVVNTAEARALAEGNPLSFLRVSRPELELPDGTDIYADEVYARAASNFESLRGQAPLIVEDEPALYLYRLQMGERTQTGLVACCSVAEYDNDTIRKHERTRKDKEDDRTRHITTLRAQTGPVFLTYRGTVEIDSLVSQLTHQAPLFDFTAPDGIVHTVWKLPADANASMVAAFGQVPVLYIADGHHRGKSASRACETLRAANPSHTGNEEYAFFQCVLFPADQLAIYPYHRVVKDLAGLTKESFLNRVGESFEVGPGDPVPSGRGEVSMYLDGSWHTLKPRTDPQSRPRVIDRLDVSVLQDYLLSPVLGIEDPRTDKRIDFVGGIRGTGELEKLVNSGVAAVAFSMHPVTVDELMEISDAGEIMPPKSTWFEPKLRDGLLSHLI